MLLCFYIFSIFLIPFVSSQNVKELYSIDGDKFTLDFDNVEIIDLDVNYYIIININSIELIHPIVVKNDKIVNYI